MKNEINEHCLKINREFVLIVYFSQDAVIKSIAVVWGMWKKHYSSDHNYI